ncbi:hypothetical protein F5877DRAFT_77480 [Lentinula edodes]|nr:hypothetical protein F5877DRAFT_77480 [Lentinula edodes]
MSSSEDGQAIFLSEYLNDVWSEITTGQQLVSRQCCAVLLKRDPDLQKLVQKAYVEENPDILKGYGLPSHPRAMVYYREELCEIFNRLETMREPLEKVVDGTATYNSLPWNLRGDFVSSTDVVEHIRKLSIPCKYRSSEPLLVLHETGRFQSEPELNERMDHIFTPDKNTFLVNSSGTGKTRLLYEGLCKHWGLFFTAAVDTFGLGSVDVQSVVNQRLPYDRYFTAVLNDEDATSDSGPVLANIALAYRRFSETLLARLLVFKLYIEIVAKGEIQEVHKRRWLLAQLQPYFTNGSDVFAVLQTTIRTSRVTDALLIDCITQCIEDIMNLFRRHSPGSHFFVVLDEANAASERLGFAFRSVHGPHPVLKEIIKTWQSHLHTMSSTMVVAGTWIPNVHFQEDNWKEWRWTSSTGAFDNFEDQRAYILKYMPRDLAFSASGQHLLHRMWVWLRGRHRMTAAFITIMLVDGFRSPHYLLNRYIQMFTDFWPSDGGEFIRAESPRSCSELDGIPMGQLERSTFSILYAAENTLISTEVNPLRVNMQHLLLKHLIADYRFTPPLFHEIGWVTTAFGRFSDDAMTCVAVDESLVLIAVAQWLLEESYLAPDLDHFISSRSFADEPLSYDLDYVAFAVALCFKRPRVVSEVLSFSTITPPNWASQRAHLVALRREGENVTEDTIEYSPEKPSQLVFYTSISSAVLDWLKDSHGVPFCMHTREATTTLYFILELEDSARICLSLRGISNSEDEDHEESAAIRTAVNEMTPLGLLKEGDALDEATLTAGFGAIPKRSLDIGSIGLLRTLVSLRNKVRIQGVPFDALDKYPVATLNITTLRDAVKDISQKDVFSSIVTSVVGDLKRKAPPETFASRTKLRLSDPTTEASSSTSVAPPPSRTKAIGGRKLRSADQPQTSNPKSQGIKNRKPSAPKKAPRKVETALSEPATSRYNLRPRKPR